MAYGDALVSTVTLVYGALPHRRLRWFPEEHRYTPEQRRGRFPFGIDGRRSLPVEL